MPAAKLPKKLHARLDFLAARVRKVRFLRAVGRAAFLLPVAALVAILADAYLGLPGWLRIGLLAGWVFLLVRELRTSCPRRTAAVDLEAVASAVEEEFPRLAERLTTAVELAGHSDESNGSPALIDEVIDDADSRARKLDLTAAFPTSGAVAVPSSPPWPSLLVLLIPRLHRPSRRGTLAAILPPLVHADEVGPVTRWSVTSGRPGRQARRPGHAHRLRRTDAGPTPQLPTAATLIVTANGKEERLAMTADEAERLVRPPAGRRGRLRLSRRSRRGGQRHAPRHRRRADHAGAAHVTVKPPAYAAQGRDRTRRSRDSANWRRWNTARSRSTCSSVREPTSAVLEFTPQAAMSDPKPDKRAVPCSMSATTARRRSRCPRPR